MDETQYLHVIKPEDACICIPSDRIANPPKEHNRGKVRKCGNCMKPFRTEFQESFVLKPKKPLISKVLTTTEFVLWLQNSTEVNTPEKRNAAFMCSVYYAKLMQKPLELGMFTPVGEDGIVIQMLPQYVQLGNSLTAAVHVILFQLIQIQMQLRYVQLRTARIALNTIGGIQSMARDIAPCFIRQAIDS